MKKYYAEIKNNIIVGFYNESLPSTSNNCIEIDEELWRCILNEDRRLVNSLEIDKIKANKIFTIKDRINFRKVINETLEYRHEKVSSKSDLPNWKNNETLLNESNMKKINSAISKKYDEIEFNQLMKKLIFKSEGIVKEEIDLNAIIPEDSASKEDLEKLFQYVSNGKGLLETAITDKGGEVSKESNIASFSELKKGIESISKGSNDSDNHICRESGRDAIYNVLVAKLPSLVNKITPDSPLDLFAFYISMIGELLLSFNENINSIELNKRSIFVSKVKDSFGTNIINESNNSILDKISKIELSRKAISVKSEIEDNIVYGMEVI